MKNKRPFLWAAAILIIGAIIYNAVSAPGIGDLPGNMKEEAFVRSEQNSGPVIRIYAVSIDGLNWTAMERYGNYMPHTKYGNTRIYFFLKTGQIPSRLELGSEPGEQFQKDCIGVYEKNGMSQVSFRKYPYR